MSTNPARTWLAARLADGAIVNTEATLRPHTSRATTATHWMPTTGSLADVNGSHMDPELDLWVTCEVRADATGARWKEGFRVYLHKRKEANVAPDHPLIQAMSRIVGTPLDLANWREWRTVVSVSGKDFDADQAIAFADEQLRAWGGAATGAAPKISPEAPIRVPDKATARVVAAPEPGPKPDTVPRSVFIASRINGYPKARAVRKSIRAELKTFGFAAYVAESDPIGGFTQSHIDKMVETSDHMVAIIWDTIGAATLAEVQLGLHNSGAGGHPRVHLFVSTDDEHLAVRAAEPNGETTALLDDLDRRRLYVHMFHGDRDLIDQVGGLFAGLDLI